MVKTIKAFDDDGKINLQYINYILDLYYNSIGLSVFALDEKGNIISKRGDTPILCNFIKSCNQNCNCEKQQLFSGRMAEKLGEDYIFSCKGGLVFFVAPLINEFSFKGCVICGPVLLDYADEGMVDDILNYNEISISMKGRVISYLRAIPVVEVSRIRYLSKMLYILTESFMNEEKIILNDRKQKSDQQSKIAEAIQEMKSSDELSIYPYEKEKELLIKVRNGDVIGAKTVLNDILGFIFFSNGGDIEVIKARTLELCTLLSRAAVEGGASVDKIFGMNYKFISELSKINNIEDLSYWTLKVLDRFGENVFNLEENKNADIIKKSLNFINDNYMIDITLDSVARYVHLNASYFSTLFKKEMHTGFSDYLNRVRIEESKQLLKNRQNSILDVALAVGFDDQSYYSKVFKKVTGITPKKYKSKE